MTSSCDSLILNCGKNQTDIDGVCYDVSYGNIEDFTGMQESDGTIISSTILAKFPSTNVLSCLNHAALLDECVAAQFDYGTDTNTNVVGQNGYCTLYSEIKTRDGPTDPISCNCVNGNCDKTGTTCQKNQDCGCCVQLYKKLNQQTNRNGFYVVDKTGTDVLSFKATSETPDSEVKIRSLSQGGYCRYVPPDNDVNMREFCQNHPDYKVCYDYCVRNENGCVTTKSPTMFAIPLAVFIISLFVFIVSFAGSKQFKTIATIVLVCASIYTFFSLYHFFQPLYTNTTPDFFPNWDITRKCEDNKCGDIFGNCK